MGHGTGTRGPWRLATIENQPLDGFTLRDRASGSKDRAGGGELADALREQLIQEGMGSQWRAESKIDGRVAILESVAGRREIALQMDSCRQEVRDHQDASCAPSNASLRPLIDIRGRELQKARLDDREVAPIAQPRGDLVEVVVGRGMAAAMGNQ
jgi:hypothetical protein